MEDSETLFVKETNYTEIRNSLRQFIKRKGEDSVNKIRLEHLITELDKY